MSMVEETSTHTNPDLANQITEKALAAPASSATPIPLPPETHYTLPGGFIDQNGMLHQDVEVRELTGADEEALSRIDTVKHPSKYLETMVMRGTVSIGGQPLSAGVYASLLTGDRDAIVLFIRRATFGDHLATRVKCPVCSFEDDMIVELDKDVPMKVMENPLERVLSVPLRAGEAQVALVNVHVANTVIDTQGKTQAELNTVTLQRCVQSVDEKPPSLQDVLDLSSADRKELLKALGEAQPGPQYREVTISCVSCGQEAPLLLTLDDLFR